MANVTLFDQTGKQAGEVVLNDAIFGIEPNQSVVFDVIISQRASLRQGTHVAMRTNFLKKFVALRLNLFTQKKLLKTNL